MADLSGFPYTEITFAKDAVFEAADVTKLNKMISDEGLTDLIVISHGWNNDMDEARGLYQGFFASLRAVSPAAAASLGSRKIGVLGVLWPSKKFADAEEIAGGAAALDTVSEADIIAQIEQLRAFLDDPTASNTLDTAKKLVPRLESTKKARNDFAAAIRSVLSQSDTGPDDSTDQFFSHSSDRLFEDLGQPVSLFVRPKLGESGGGATTVGAMHAPQGRVAEGEAASLGGLLSGIKGAAFKLMNFATYYGMKQRAGILGRDGLGKVLRDTHTTNAGLRLHLAGHSFGARLVTAAAASTGVAPAYNVASMTLLQAAFSHHAFAHQFDGIHDGFFRDVVQSHLVKGPLLITHSDNDHAVGNFYPLASLVAGDNAASIGGPDSEFGGLGQNGAQKTPEATAGNLLAVGVSSGYAFADGGVYNLEGTQYIASHGSVTGKEICQALLASIAVTT